MNDNRHNFKTEQKQPFRSIQYYKFCAYGFLKNLRFFDAFLILILREAGFSFFQIGTLYSIREIVKNIFEIPSGIVADSYGRKNAMIFSFSAYLISFAIFTFSKMYFLFALAMVLFGIGEAFRSGTHKAMILRYLELNGWLNLKTQFYGRTRSWSQIGSALSSLIAIGIIFISKQYRMLFMISMVPYILDLLNILSYPGYLNKVENQNLKRDGSDNLWSELKEVLKSYFKQFDRVTNLRPFLSAAAYGGFFKSLKDYLQPLLQTLAVQLPLFLFLIQKQRTAVLVGLSYFVLYLLTSYSSRNAFKLENRLKNLPLAIDAAYIAGLLTFLLSGISIVLGLPVLAAFLFVGMYLVQNIRRPLMVSYLSEVLPSNIMASGLSTATQIEILLIVIVSPIVGALVDWLSLGWGLTIISLIFLALFKVVKLSK
ncbi:MAG: MFS transporter [Calditrichaeota bacterium]|nr:MFS transporter [Calditrichota bacterium]